MANKFVSSNEYLSFRSAIPLKRVIVDDNDSKVWRLYDAGPKSIKCPIVCLPPASGKADMFYRQILGLSAIGYRVISLEYPVYWSVEEFCMGLRKVIDYLHLDQIHIFGCSLGAFLGMKFAERMRNTPYVASMVFCNGFTDTSVFKYTRACSAFWMIPSFILKRLVMSSYSNSITDAPQADATDFVVDCLDSLTQQEIASRLLLHCNGEYLRNPQELQNIPVTIIDVFDECAVSQSVKDDIYKCFPYAKRAHLKSGGNFPYLSRAAEVNLHLRIHLKPFGGTRSSAQEENEGLWKISSVSASDPGMHLDSPSIMRSSRSRSCGSEHSDEEATLDSRFENGNNVPATLLDVSKMGKNEDLDTSVPTIEVDDGNAAIDFPI